MQNVTPGSGLKNLHEDYFITWQHGTRPPAAGPPPDCRPSRPGSQQTWPPKAHQGEVNISYCSYGIFGLL